MSQTTTDVLLGAGGSIAAVLAPVLVQRGHRVRLVSRSGHAMAGTEAVRGDLLDASSVMAAVDEGATVFLLAGLRYEAAVWEEQWPRIMRHAIDGCSARGARLVFFDNVYMYGPVEGPMTEQTPVRPRSRKGAVRARIADDLMSAVAAGKVQALIARAADFYGPHGKNSIVCQLVLEPLSQGKRAKWPANPDVPHSFTFVPDCGPALATLAQADDAWGQVWHLPTAAPPLTGREYVALAAQSLAAAPRLMTLAPWTFRLGGLFDTTIRESVEMLYQYDRPYIFDSSKFERRFSFRPTPYADGIAHAARELRGTQ